MTDPSDSKSRDQIFDATINVVIRIGLLLLIGFVSLFVIAPFLTVLLWSVILAVTLFPVYLEFPRFRGQLRTSKF